MKSFRASLTCAFAAGFLFLFLGGCNIKWEVVQDPYANYHRIEQRVQIQLNQINNLAQNGSLWPPMAQVLSENDDMVRQMAWHDQGGQSVDLTPQQAAILDSFLNDNAMAINDAVARHDQWAQAFSGGWAPSPSTYSDRLMTIAYLHYQLDRQQASIDDALQSGTMTPAQAQDLKTRIQVIRNSEAGCYNTNGRLDLNPTQIGRLRQMAEDNDRLLRFRTRGQHGRWKGDEYGGWGGQKKQYTDNSWLNGAPPSDDPNRGQTTHGRYWDGRPFKQRASAPTPVPYQAAPTSTPVPAPPGPTPLPTRYHAWNPTPTVQPVAAVPTPTPVPVVSAPTAVPTSAPTHYRAWVPTPTSQPLAAAPTATPVPVVSAPTPLPTPASQPVAQAPTSTPVPSQNPSDDSDFSDHRRHKKHGDLPGNPDNGGNTGDSDGSNHHGHSDNQGGDENSPKNDPGNSDNGGNADNSDGSSHHGHSDNQGGDGNPPRNDSGN